MAKHTDSEECNGPVIVIKGLTKLQANYLSILLGKNDFIDQVNYDMFHEGEVPIDHLIKIGAKVIMDDSCDDCPRNEVIFNQK